MSLSAIERLIDASVRCHKCHQGINDCECYEKCSCGWSFDKGSRCRNPMHWEPPYDVECPHCHQPAGAKCQNPDGVKMAHGWTHKRRDKASPRPQER